MNGYKTVKYDINNLKTYKNINTLAVVFLFSAPWGKANMKTMEGTKRTPVHLAHLYMG